MWWRSPLAEAPRVLSTMKKSVSFSTSANQTLYINESSDENGEDDADDEESIEDEQEQGVHEEQDEFVASGDGSTENPAWADAMARLLGSSVSKSSNFILAKAKKDRDLVDKPKASSSFEVVKEDGQSDLVSSEARVNHNKEPSKRKGGVNPKIKLLDNTLKSVDQCDRAKELRLAAIATKGVVQLFNAVDAQLNEIEQKVEDAGPLERKQKKARASVDEKVFMQTLEKMNDDDDAAEEEKPPAKRSKRKGKTSSTGQKFADVFTDDFAAAV